MEQAAKTTRMRRPEKSSGFTEQAPQANRREKDEQPESSKFMEQATQAKLREILIASASQRRKASQRGKASSREVKRGKASQRGKA